MGKSLRGKRLKRLGLFWMGVFLSFSLWAQTGVICGTVTDAKMKEPLIGELLDELRRERFRKVRLAVDRGNPQSKAFWEKNGFALMGEEFPHGDSAYLPMERAL